MRRFGRNIIKLALHHRREEERMFRIIAVALLVLTLPACAISPPSSLFSSLNNDEDQKPVRVAREEVRPEPQPKQEAGIGGSIGNLWGSMKSGLGIGGGKTKAPEETKLAASGEIETLSPEQAQQLVNAYREQNGLKPLRLNPKLNIAALIHSKDLAKSDRISHYGSDGSDTWDRVRRTGYQARLTAENVGTGQRSLGEVFRGWQKSKDHNANLLLADAEEMGIAMVHENDTQFKTFWTMVVGAPATTSAAVQ
jgi:uncharacterized protein YkwD